jgi:hypothetical protein
MKQNVYTIKDAKSGTFATPFFSINDATATRSFQQAANDPNTTINQFPEDYALYKLGTFDDASAEIVSNLPEFVSNPKTQPDSATESIEKHL